MTNTALQQHVEMAVQLGMTTPFNTAFASAIPEPPLTGAIATGTNASMARNTLIDTCWARP